MNDEASLTIKVQSTEEVQPGPPRAPAPPAPSAPPISQAPVQPPVTSPVQPPAQAKPVTPAPTAPHGTSAPPVAPPTSDELRKVLNWPTAWAGDLSIDIVAEKDRPKVLKDIEQLRRAAAQAAGNAPQGPSAEAAELAKKAIERDRLAMEVEMARRAQGMPGVGTRGDVLLREKERREREAAGQAPHDEAWAAERAKEQTQREAEKRAIENARIATDPVYAEKVWQEELAKGKRAERQADAEERRQEREEQRREREARKQQREAEAARPHDIGWAMERVKSQMAKERDQQMLEQAKRQLDPAYAKKKDEDAAKKSDSETTQKATFAAMALGAGGMPGLARIPAMYATGRQVGAAVGQMAGAAPGLGASVGGPIGAVIGVVGYVMEKLREGIQQAFKVGAAMISFDPDKLARGFADLIGKVPLVGGLMGGLAHGILDLGDAVHSTAQRLSAYSGQLAMQLAQQEIVRIQRDIRRAQEFGPQIAAAENARFEFENKVNRFMDKYTPMFLRIAERLLDMVSGIMEFPDRLHAAFAEQVANVLEVIDNIFPGNVFKNIIDALREIAKNTNKEPDLNLEDQFVQELLGMQQGLQQLIGPAPNANQPLMGGNPFVGNAAALGAQL